MRCEKATIILKECFLNLPDRLLRFGMNLKLVCTDVYSIVRFSESSRDVKVFISTYEPKLQSGVITMLSS